MKGRSAYIKTVYRLIIGSPMRFFAIFAIAALGVGFFAGLRAVSPDKKATIEKYFNEKHVYDIRVLSPSGFTESDIAEMRAALAADGATVFPAYGMDVFADTDDKSRVVTVKSFDPDAEVNVPVLTEGRLPSAADECVVDDALRTAEGYAIGTLITLSSGNAGELSYYLSNTTYKITGFVNSPVYVSADRGTSTIGSGKIGGFILIPIENFTLPVYSEVFIKINNLNVSRFSAEYDDMIAVISEKLEKPERYVLPIAQNTGFALYKENCDRIAAVAIVVPFIFYLVAALVSLTQMTRITENDRDVIGVQKALGYASGVIVLKYVFYAFLASAAGGAVGLAVGLRVFPSIIYNAYLMLYSTPSLVLSVKAFNCMPELIICVLCTVLPAAAISLGETLGQPAKLLRPKAPLMGKRILLERLTPVWKRMKFTHKVTARNLFRFKKRLYMTVVGITGCTSLLLTGFGLYDSIKSILEIQFGHVLKYDYQIALKPGASAELENIADILEYRSGSTGYMPIYSALHDVYAHDGDKFVSDVYMIACEPEIDNYISLRDRKTKNPFSLGDDGVVITEKLSKLLDIGMGETIEIPGEGGVLRSLPVSDVTENYTMHYIYISPSLYADAFGELPAANMIIGSLQNTSEESQALISTELLKLGSVGGISFNANTKSSYSDSLNTLNAIVFVIIVTSAALAFVVLFSLYGITIDERKRELATIKVLGFFETETTMYIFRENIILTLIGALFGLILGVPLHAYVMKTCEPDFIMFAPDLRLLSFLLSGIMTAAFSIIVNIIMAGRIKKIDMVESLKSVE